MFPLQLLVQNLAATSASLSPAGISNDGRSGPAASTCTLYTVGFSSGGVGPPTSTCTLYTVGFSSGRVGPPTLFLQIATSGLREGTSVSPETTLISNELPGVTSSEALQPLFLIPVLIPSGIAPDSGVSDETASVSLAPFGIDPFGEASAPMLDVLGSVPGIDPAEESGNPGVYFQVSPTGMPSRDPGSVSSTTGLTPSGVASAPPVGVLDGFSTGDLLGLDSSDGQGSPGLGRHVSAAGMAQNEEGSSSIDLGLSTSGMGSSLQEGAPTLHAQGYLGGVSPSDQEGPAAVVLHGRVAGIVPNNHSGSATSNTLVTVSGVTVDPVVGGTRVGHTFILIGVGSNSDLVRGGNSSGLGFPGMLSEASVGEGRIAADVSATIPGIDPNGALSWVLLKVDIEATLPGITSGEKVGMSSQALQVRSVGVSPESYFSPWTLNVNCTTAGIESSGSEGTIPAVVQLTLSGIDPSVASAGSVAHRLASSGISGVASVGPLGCRVTAELVGIEHTLVGNMALSLMVAVPGPNETGVGQFAGSLAALLVGITPENQSGAEGIVHTLDNSGIGSEESVNRQRPSVPSGPIFYPPPPVIAATFPGGSGFTSTSLSFQTMGTSGTQRVPLEPYFIGYTLFEVVGGTLRRVGPERRRPVSSAFGVYHVPGQAGDGGGPGLWMVRWTVQKSFGGPQAIFDVYFTVTSPVVPGSRRGWF